MPHVARPALARRFPVHVTLRVAREVWNLRSQRCFRLIRRAFVLGNDRFGFRLNQFSVQGNHLHLLVEAANAQSLTRGIKGLAVRIARRLNRLMQRRGQVFPQRYHARILRTPSEVPSALSYVLANLHKHSRECGNPLLPNQIDAYSSAYHDATAPPATVGPHTWLLRRFVWPLSGVAASRNR